MIFIIKRDIELSLEIKILMKGYQTAGGFISNKIADIITQIVPSESTTPAQTENYTKNII